MAKKVRLDLVMDSRIKTELFDYCAKHDVSVSHYVEMLVAEELSLWDVLYMRPVPWYAAETVKPCGKHVCLMTCERGQFPDCPYAVVPF